MKYKITVNVIFTFLIFLFKPSHAQDNNFIRFEENGYAEIQNFNDITSLEKGTISFWANTVTPNKGKILFSSSNEGDNVVGGNELYIVQREDEAVQLVTILNGRVYTDAWTPAHSFPINGWHNITAVFDPTRNIEIYIDGIRQPLTIGACCNGRLAAKFFQGVSPLKNMFLGKLKRATQDFFSHGSSFDNFGIWNVPFTADDVIQNINNKGNFKKCNLVTFYDFEYPGDIGSEEIILPNSKDIVSNGPGLAFDITRKNHNAKIYEGFFNVLYLDKNLKLAERNYVDIQHIDNITVLDAGSINFKFKIGDLTKENLLFSASNKGVTYVNNSEFYINYRGSGRIQVTGNLNGVVTLDANTKPKTIADNEYHNLTVVSNTSGQIKVYIDGIDQALEPGSCCNGHTEHFFFGDLSGLNNITIGSLQRVDPTPTVYTNNAIVDDFSIWNIVLTPDQINSIKDSKNYYQSCGLVVYYNFDIISESDGLQYYKDLSNNDHIGIIKTGALEDNEDGEGTEAGEGTVLGINKNNYLNSSLFKLQSNIISDKLTILSDIESNVDVIITDLQGNTVSKQSLSLSSQNSVTTTNLKNGLYVVKVSSKEATSTFKVIKSTY